VRHKMTSLLQDLFNIFIDSAKCSGMGIHFMMVWRVDRESRQTGRLLRLPECLRDKFPS
jgi:hypothetical protein